MAQTTAELTGRKVAAEMRFRKITQTQLAAQLGMSQQMLSARLLGKTPFDVDELVTVATALDMDPRDLLLAELA